MLDFLIKKFKLVKVKDKNYRMRYAAICTGCGTILQFNIDTSTSIMIEDGSEAINRFECKSACSAYQLYFTCHECDKLMKHSIDIDYKPVLVIPKDLALATKVIIDSGLTVTSMCISTVISTSINLSNGMPNYYSIIPICGGLEVRGKKKSNAVYDLMKSIINNHYDGIFYCSKTRIMNSEEANILEDDDSDRSINELNTPEEEQLYEISIYASKEPDTKMRVKSESEIDYGVIEDKNNKFIMLISIFAESLTDMMCKEN